VTGVGVASSSTVRRGGFEWDEDDEDMEERQGGILARAQDRPHAGITGPTRQPGADEVLSVGLAPRIDYSFADFVASRKGEAAARLREGAVYAYGGDLKVRATLDRVRPVTLAMEAATRFWHSVGKNRLLGNAIRVGDRQFPDLQALLDRCVEALQIERPVLYISPSVLPLDVHTLGTSEEAAIVLGSGLRDNLGDEEMVSVIGHACGHIQNNHTAYLTTLYLLGQAGNFVVRWAARPAVLGLRNWSRRAEITCDRASLICSRSLDVTIAAMVKRALGSRRLFSEINVEEYLQQLDETQSGPGRFQELLASNPYLPKRVKALRIFAETTFYKSVIGKPATPEDPGLTREVADAQVSELLKVLG
jgi:Zn-dependent protease with chaperone function